MNITPSPHVTVEDHMGKPQSGTYVGHKTINRGHLSNVILERKNGSRFRFVALTADVDDALSQAQK